MTKKRHVYRVAGMIASIRGKKPHVYRVIILKQMADHTNEHFSGRKRKKAHRRSLVSKTSMVRLTGLSLYIYANVSCDAVYFRR